MSFWFCTIAGKPVGWRQQLSARGGFAQSRLADNAKLWKEQAAQQMAIEWIGPPLAEAVGLRVTSVFPRPQSKAWIRKPMPAYWYTGVPDSTNCLKLAEDALVLAGVLVDDRWVVEQHNRSIVGYGLTTPRVKVELFWGRRLGTP